MANYSTLKAAVADVVKTNGLQAITGANLQTVFLAIINSIGGGGYIFNGVATPSTDAGTPDQNVFYIGGAGTYANFGTSVVVPPTNIAVFKYNGTWNCEQLTVENGGVFDISAYNNNTTYADLAAALGTNGANVPQSLRKGGMSVKFVCSSDNKYVQYRLMSDTFNTTVANWQGVDDEPTAGSDNLVKSRGVYSQIRIVEELLGRESEEKQMNVAVDGKYVNSVGTPATYAPFGISNAINVHKGDLLVIKARSASTAGLICKVITENSRWTVLQMGTDTANIVTTYYSVEEDCSIQFSYYKENGISVNVYSSDVINSINTRIVTISNYLAQGYIYAGVATPNGNPGTVAGKIFYITKTAGTYTNYGGLTVVSGVSIITYDGTNWAVQNIFEQETTPTIDSVKLIESGGVAEALGMVTKNIVITDASNLHTDEFRNYIKQGTKVYIRLNSLSPSTLVGVGVYVAYQGNLSDLTTVGFIDRYDKYLEFTAPIDFCYIQMRRNGISFSMNYTVAIKGVEQDIDKVDIKTQEIPIIQNKQDFYEVNTFGSIPKLYQGAVDTSGVWNPTNQARCTTKVFRNPDTNGIILTAKAGYEVVLAHGDSENSLTELGYVISGTNGGTYKYTGGKPYLYLNIAKKPTAYFSPSDVDNGSILIESSTSINQRLEVLNKEKYNSTPQVFEMSVYGNIDGIRKLYTSPFVLYAGRKYKIEFESNNFATDVATGGAYFIIRNEEATYSPLTLTSSSAGSKPIPSTINNYTPTKNGTLFVYANLSEGAYLNIKVTQVDQDVLQLIKDNSKLFEAVQTLKEINVENMLLGGTVVGEVETTTTFPCGHVFVTNDNGVTGDCYIATFQSKTKINEYDGKPTDYAGVLVGFNLANPERTAHTYVALAPDDVVFEGQEYLAGYCEDCVAAQLDSNTIRCFMSTANETYSVYRDFDLLTKTFEQYCHQAYIVIEGTQYRLMGNNAQTILHALGLQSSSSSNSCYRRSCPIKVGEYFYQVIGFDDVTTLCRSKNFGDDWQFVTQIPTNGDNVDEVAIYYANNRIYTMWTGNKTRRPNGDYDKVCYLDVTWGQDGDNLDIITGGIWSEPITLDMTGHDAPTIVVSDGKVYLIAQKLKYTSVQEDKVERANVYLDGTVVNRSIKSIYVFDLELNLIKEVTLRLRRGINTPRLATYAGNMYFYCGTNPKSIPDADTRQNLIFSYVDERIINI